MEINLKSLSKNPVKSIFPIIKPENAVGLYLTSKSIEKDQSLRKPLDFENARESILLDFIKSKRYLRSSEENLRLKREKYLEFHKKFDVELQDLIKKEQTLKDSFLSFNQFVNENVNKRERAEKKIQFERKLIKINDEAIKEISKEKEKLSKIKIKLEEKVKEVKMYEDYLKVVIDQDENIRDINDFINQYESLVYARKTLSERHDRNLRNLEQLKDEMLKLISNKTLIITGLNGTLKSLEERYNKAKRDVLKWEEILQNVKRNATDLYTEIANVKASIRQIYLDMCQRSKLDDQFKPDDYKNQLQFIKVTLKMVENSIQKANECKHLEYLSI